MTALGKAQRLLASAIDAGGLASPALCALIASGGLAAERRAAIYRESSRRARERALEATYPVCRQLLGERCFATLAAGFIEGYPSTCADLNRYGDAFPRYLEWESGRHAALTSVVYLADLARLEQCWHAAYYAPNDPGFDAARFAAMAEEEAAAGVRFQLSASLHLLASDYPISEIWRRHREGGDTAAVTMGAGDRLVVSRVGFRPQVETAEPETFELLMGIFEGKRLCDLAQGGCAVEQIPGLIAAGWVVAFSSD